MAYTSRFTFRGNVLIPKDHEKFFHSWKGGKDNNTDMVKIQFGIRESKTNSCFVECFGATYDTIRIKNEAGETKEISWEDRFDEDIIAEVPYFRKYIAEFDDGEKQFLTQYDFIKYIAEKLETYEGRVYCTGRFNKDYYKGEVYDHYIVDTVRTTSETSNSMEVKMDLYYNRDCVDLSEFEDKHRITLNAYVKQYVNRDVGEKFFPQRVVLDTNKCFVDDDEKKLKFARLMEGKVNIKNKEVIHSLWSSKVIRGAETIEFDESMLTDAQREQIAFDIATIDDFNKPVFGENIYEFRLIRQELQGDFSNGAIDSGLTMAELEAELFSQPKPTETIEDIESAIDDESMDAMLEECLG